MVNYHSLLLIATILGGSICTQNSAFFVHPARLQKTCVNIDYDGIVAEDVPVKTQFKAALKTVPIRVILTTLFWNIPTLVRAAWNRGFYDEMGNKAIGHDAYLRAFAKNAPAFEPYCSQIITALAPATPLYETIALIQKWQQEGAKVVVWTNNDEPMFLEKYKYLNAQLMAEGKEPLHVDGYFIVGSDKPHASLVGKPKVEYYKKAFAYSQSVIGDTGEWEHYFIDDKIKNVVAPDEYAKQVGINLTALHHPNFEQFTQNLVAQTSLPYNSQEVVVA